MGAMQSKHGVVLLLGQAVIFVAALVVGFRLLAPKPDRPNVDLPAITFNAARTALADASRRRRFARSDELLRAIPIVPVGVGIEVRPLDSTTVEIQSRFRRQRCALLLRLSDSVPGRPRCS